MLRLFTFSVLAFLLIMLEVGGFMISEIHPNPDDACRDCSEWIEIYNDNTSDNFSVNGEMLNISFDDYIILTRNKSIFIGLWDADPEKVFEFGIRLPNSGGEIDVSRKTVSYPSFSSKSGLSYSLVNDIYTTEEPSPLFIEKDTVTEEIEIINETEYNSCNLSIIIESDLVFKAEESGIYYLVVEDSECHENHPVKLAYSVEDLFGKVIFSRETEKEMSCTLRVKRSWTPSNIEESKGYKISSEIADPGCDNLGDFETEKIVIVKGEYPRKASELEIERVFWGSDKSVLPGETFSVKLRVYRGETERTSVDVWVEGSEPISDVSKFNYNKNYMEGKVTIPIMLFDQCFEEEEFHIVAEGFGLKEIIPLNIDLTSCIEEEVIVEENITEETIILKNTTNKTVRIPTGHAVKKESSFISNLMKFLNGLMFGII